MIVLSRFRFFVFSLITNCLFLSVLNFDCNTNRINPLLVIISSKLPAITNVTQLAAGVADYSQRQ